MVMFNSQLILKLDEISEQSELKRQSVKAKAIEHQRRTAQHSAIEILNQHRIDASKVAAIQRDQQQLDEVARGQHFERECMKKEQNDE